MNNSRYSLVVVFRVILICLNCFFLLWLYTYTNRPATTLLVLIILIFQAISLIRYHNTILNDLANFLLFLQENDTTLAFSQKKIEWNFKGLTKNLETINQKLQLAGIKQEQQFQYLQAIVRQVDTGIITFDQDGKIDLLNQSARDILGIHAKQNVTEITLLYPELSGILNPGIHDPVAPVKLRANGKERILAFQSVKLKMEEKVINLVSFQNIRTELEAGELDAWRKLIRIQRHEIINSITPITTLTTAIKRIFKMGDIRKSLHEISDEQIDDALKSVDVIEDRSLGLIDFVERFKSLTDVPVLKKKLFKLDKFFEGLAILFAKDLADQKINLKINIIPQNLSAIGDEKLLEQALINLLKNSIEAIHRKDGEITVSANLSSQHNLVMQVRDNGTGMDGNTLENIFIPAFTTKENGSGIGLSITRQIIHMHQGMIEVHSTPGVETVFEITMPL